jgi:hypothetical protein
MKQYIVIGLSLVLFCAGGSVGFASEVTGSLTTGIGSGMSGVVIAAPTASPVAGTYTSTQTVTLSASGATSIHYTTDGTTPTCTTGSTVSGTISIPSTATIQAISCYPNSGTSTVASFAYTISVPAATVTSGGGGGGGGGYYNPYTPTPTTTAPTGGTLQAQQQLLALLIAQLQSLLRQAQAQGIQLSSSTANFLSSLPTTPTGGAYTFTRSLTVGSRGEDVRELQKFLNAKGFTVSASGAGSPGSETTLFGAATRAALAKYQASVGISPAAGYFGPATRAYVNAHQ